MVLAEEEAKQRWCPFSSTGAYTDRGPMGAVSVNRDPRPEVESACRCLGSGCMAWRWLDPWDATKGFCGLAKRPVEA